MFRMPTIFDHGISGWRLRISRGKCLAASPIMMKSIVTARVVLVLWQKSSKERPLVNSSIST